MKDIIIGRVGNVIDFETINVEVTQIVRSRQGVYNSEEKVRLKTLQHGLRSIKNIKNKRFIESMVKGKGVMCLIIGRDVHGCIEADVYVL